MIPFNISTLDIDAQVESLMYGKYLVAHPPIV